MFGKKPELYLPSGKRSYKTMSGCLCSLLVYGVVLLFIAATVRDILDNKMTSVKSTLKLDELYAMTSFPAQGDELSSSFQVAFGITE